MRRTPTPCNTTARTKRLRRGTAALTAVGSLITVITAGAPDTTAAATKPAVQQQAGCPQDTQYVFLGVRGVISPTVCRHLIGLHGTAQKWLHNVRS
jgi:hypothetical protein